MDGRLSITRINGYVVIITLPPPCTMPFVLASHNLINLISTSSLMAIRAFYPRKEHSIAAKNQKLLQRQVSVVTFHFC